MSSQQIVYALFVFVLYILGGCCKCPYVSTSQYTPRSSFQINGTKIIYQGPDGKPLIRQKRKSCYQPVTFQEIASATLEEKLPLLFNLDGQGHDLIVRLNSLGFEKIRSGREPKNTKGTFVRHQNDLYLAQLGVTIFFINPRSLDVAGESKQADPIPFHAPIRTQIYLRVNDDEPGYGYDVATDLLLEKLETLLGQFFKSRGLQLLSKDSMRSMREIQKRQERQDRLLFSQRQRIRPSPLDDPRYLQQNQELSQQSPRIIDDYNSYAENGEDNSFPGYGRPVKTERPQQYDPRYQQQMMMPPRSPRMDPDYLENPQEPYSL